MSEPVLCYVCKPWAYFTTNKLEQQWGDDWDDAPYEHNAGVPYADDGCKIIKLAYDAELETPAERAGFNSSYSVEEINSGAVAWLVSPSWCSEDKVVIPAGTGISNFLKLVKQAGGVVYLKSD